jgi:hypothetical protein
MLWVQKNDAMREPRVIHAGGGIDDGVARGQLDAVAAIGVFDNKFAAVVILGR